MISKSFRRAAIALVASLLLAATTAAADISAPIVNQLKNHDSPYLALHGDDPTKWQKWNKDVIDRAKAEGKIIFVSSGYFSCHWCHVMQRQSYQNDDVAKILNDKFIPVKIDRELDTALDKRLMDFAQATQGRGGWPLNVYLTPEGFPLYAHMYQPPETFSDVLGKLQNVWGEQQEKLTQLAKDHSIVDLKAPADTFDVAQADRYEIGLVSVLPDAMDEIEGGFGNQTKFPMVPQIDFYLQYERTHPNSDAREWLVTSFDAMASLGLRDHVGGGFFRYTTDPSWEVPHFEKMLYTNAMLSQQYLRASKVLNKPAYESVARDTLDFMIRDMRDDSGAMIAAFSAVDDEGIEGKFYLWRPAQLDAALSGKQLEFAKALFGLEGPMMFPEGYLPMYRMKPSSAAAMAQLDESQIVPTIDAVRKSLFAARKDRSLPADTKLLAGWNGLALASFAEAARTLNESRYSEAAKGIRDYLMSALWDGSELQRAVAGGKSLGSASVEDYAYVSEGLYEYAMLTGKADDFALAATVAEQGYARFNRDNGWYLSESTLIVAEQPTPALNDGATPSPSAVLAHTSIRLAEKLGDKARANALRANALRTLAPADRYLETNLFGFASYIGTMARARSANTAAQ